MKSRKAVTLLEIVFTLTLVVFLVSASFLIYIVTLRGWDELGDRTDLHEKLHFALERVVREVREGNELFVANHGLRFRERVTDDGFIYYLHNASDVWPPAYTQSAYDLRRASLTEAGVANDLIDDTFNYGDGTIIAIDLNPPASGTTITSTGNYAVITLQATSGDSTLSVRGNAKLRNV
jgi:hypothetical protein